MEDSKKIIPGFMMGIVRAAISHPFEIMKLKSQINYKGFLGLRASLSMKLL
jgi:hypothetical protein